MHPPLEGTQWTTTPPGLFARATGLVAALASALAALAVGPGLVPAGSAALPEPGQSLDVLVVGDSYSAGNGAGGTTYGPEGCYRNTGVWSEKYAAGLRDQGYSVTLRNHAGRGRRLPQRHRPLQHPGLPRRGVLDLPDHGGLRQDLDL